MKLGLLLLVVILQGCASAPLVLTGIGAGSIVVSETTGKSVTDHAVSAVNNQDCATVRYFKNQPVCQDYPVTADRPQTKPVTVLTEDDNIKEISRYYTMKYGNNNGR